MEDEKELTSAEQIKALLHSIREQVMQVLSKGPATPSEVARAIGLPANKVHYHVAVLDRHGLVRLVETRTVGSVTEKYYEAVAKHFVIRSVEKPSSDQFSTVRPLLEREFRKAMDSLVKHLSLPQEEQPTMHVTVVRAGATEQGRASTMEAIEELRRKAEKALSADPPRSYKLLVTLVPALDSEEEE